MKVTLRIPLDMEMTKCPIHVTPRKVKLPRGLRKYTERDILRMRWLVEWKGWTPVEVKSLYKIPSTRASDIFLYKVLPSLRPCWNDFNE